MGRRETMLGMIDQSGMGLEIGPSYAPLLPKRQGYQVETLDYASAEQLREKYRDAKAVDVSAIEPVDYVSDGRPMREVIGRIAAYDFIVASHVIEHVPDLLGFLDDCAALLKPAGVLALAVPDKRYCFDALQPLSSTGGVLQARLEARRRPTPGQCFDSLAYDVLRGGAIGWNETDSGPIVLANTLEAAQQVYQFACASPSYVDVHVWRFTPSSFRLILQDTHALGLTAMRETAFYPTVGMEFFAALSVTGGGSGLGRLELALAAQRELRATAI